MRAIFIAFFLFLSSLQFNTLYAFQTAPSRQAATWANAQIAKLSFSQQLDQLIWTLDSGSSKGGRITHNPQISKNIAQIRTTYSVLNMYDGIEGSQTEAIPFPSYQVRKEQSAESKQFANQLYTADFIIDLKPISSVVFYGIILKDNQVILKPHFKKDSLELALSIYDQIWWLSTNSTVEEVLGRGKKMPRKTKKRIQKLAQSALANRFDFKKKKKPISTNYDDYTRWAWNLYSRSFSLLNNPSKLPIKLLDNVTFCTTTLGNEPFNAFRRHLNFYINHAYYPNALDFDTPYNLKRLANYDYLLVPAMKLTNLQLQNLNSMSTKTNVVLVWYSSKPIPSSLSSQITQIQVPQLNGVTEALAPQLVYGALGFVANTSAVSYAPASVSTLPLGRLQFAPPAVAHLDSEVLAKISNVVEEGLREQAMPGTQLLAAKNGIICYYQNFGYKTYTNDAPIEDNNLYDLASLTKVMATTQAIMFLTERGLLDLDRPIAHYLPEMWGTDKEFIPVREIMAHQAGLYPYIPFWKQVLPKHDSFGALTHKKSNDAFQIGKGTYIAPYLQDSLLSWSIHSKRLRKPKNEQPYGYRYSDIGFIILKTLVERLVNQPLDEFLDQNLYTPLGMSRTTFTPLCKFPSDDIVPTEGNGKFRFGELTGFVNDQNAALIGGVSGHAGLFSTALDLAKLMQMQLQLGSYGGTTFLYPETILNFTKRQYVGNRRGLGWDKPSRGSNGPTTDLASQKTFGHTGFTGTAAWADPEHQLIFIFLSNRVYPDPENFKLIKLNIRTRIQGLLYEAIDYNN